jgi:hypothetical protein
MLTIGSIAMNWNCGHQRTPRDHDVICTYDDFRVMLREDVKYHGEPIAVYPISNGNKWVAKFKDYILEAEIAWEGSTAESLLKICEPQGLINCASNDVLYTLKMSHRYLKNSPHFLKTMKDIHFLRSKGAKIPEYLTEWFKIREAETYSYDHPKLNVNKGEFFSGDGIDYVYDHDSLHEAVKELDRPAYTNYMKDGSDVMVDMDKFDRVDDYIRRLGVYEECAVLALERSQIPFEGRLTPSESFDKALMKVCTSITSGRFREYAWENYHNVLETYNDIGVDTYVEKFKEGLANGTVKAHNSSIKV